MKTHKRNDPFLKRYITVGCQLFVEVLREHIPDIDLSCLYSVNIKPDVLRLSLDLGVGRAEQRCACEFVDQHADAVRSMGGFRQRLHY